MLVRIGFGLLIAGIFYLIWHLLSKGSWRPLPEDAGLSSCIEFQRRQLEQQRDLVSSVWRWYLGPLIPGMAMLLVAFYHANPGHLKHPASVVLPEAVFFAVICIAIAKLNGNAARKLQRQIDELDERRNGNSELVNKWIRLAEGDGNPQGKYRSIRFRRGVDQGGADGDGRGRAETGGDARREQGPSGP